MALINLSSKMVIKACDEIIERIDTRLKDKNSYVADSKIFSESILKAESLKGIAQYSPDGTVYVDYEDLLLIGEYLPKERNEI